MTAASRRVDYRKTLDRLAAMLRRGPMTARAISDTLGCCRPAAYQRVAALRKRGDHVYEMRASDPTRSGPEAVAYGVR